MKPKTPRRSLLSRAFPIVATVLFGGVGLFVVLAVLGFLPWFKTKVDPNKGKVAVLVSNQAIPAYTKITRDFLVMPETLAPSVVWLKPEDVDPKLLNHASKLMGRVLKRDKAKGYAFTEEDFFPEHTRPGVVAGIPPGERALALDADKMKGLYSLRAGDHFDLLATVPLEEKKPGANTTVVSAVTNLTKHAAVKCLVENGTVVVPATVRKAPEGTPKNSPAAKPGNAEIVISAKPEQIAKLSEALALHQEITAIARSGRPDDLGDSSFPPEPPPVPRKGMDLLSGGKRHFLEFSPFGRPLDPEPPPAPGPKVVDARSSDGR